MRCTEALLVAMVAVAAGVSGEPRAQAGCSETLGQRTLELLNRERAEHDLPPLAVDLRLVTAARRHARDMAAHDFMEHRGTDGTRPAERVQAAGYRWRLVSENLAAGQRTPQAVVDAWMESPVHRANILEPKARNLGVGHALEPSSTYHNYWVVNFGATDDSVVAPADGCHP